ncbi:uncharacterized protein UV8b_03377 [Ustilaginoidea virens]|uniref:Uncharacterized protein n=1 Tax=Ustilaginoidea virens TaxID=1159556 RepID=A0A8E5HPD2_USTVR|nr:uncharacterized protein UV8b_03377 [Ustilaginoidea virens]QUC19136.1 hypothetical protein UV8b_03377 [Ustilaginoidea virens]
MALEEWDSGSGPVESLGRAARIRSACLGAGSARVDDVAPSIAGSHLAVASGKSGHHNDSGRKHFRPTGPWLEPSARPSRLDESRNSATNGAPTFCGWAQSSADMTGLVGNVMGGSRGAKLFHPMSLAVALPPPRGSREYPTKQPAAQLIHDTALQVPYDSGMATLPPPFPLREATRQMNGRSGLLSTSRGILVMLSGWLGGVQSLPWQSAYTVVCCACSVRDAFPWLSDGRDADGRDAGGRDATTCGLERKHLPSADLAFGHLAGRDAGPWSDLSQARPDQTTPDASRNAGVSGEAGEPRTGLRFAWGTACPGRQHGQRVYGFEADEFPPGLPAALAVGKWHSDTSNVGAQAIQQAASNAGQDVKTQPIDTWLAHGGPEKLQARAAPRRPIMALCSDFHLGPTSDHFAHEVF